MKEYFLGKYLEHQVHYFRWYPEWARMGSRVDLLSNVEDPFRGAPVTPQEEELPSCILTVEFRVFPCQHTICVAHSTLLWVCSCNSILSMASRRSTLHSSYVVSDSHNEFRTHCFLHGRWHSRIDALVFRAGYFRQDPISTDAGKAEVWRTSGGSIPMPHLKPTYIDIFRSCVVHLA